MTGRRRAGREPMSSTGTDQTAPLDDPGALASVAGVGQGGAGQQLASSTTSDVTAPLASHATSGNEAARPPANGKASPDHRAEDAAEIARLAVLPPLDYDRERQPAAKRLGCRPAILDQLVEAARAAGKEDAPGAARHGRTLGILDIEPWTGSVDGADLLDGLAQIIRRYVALDAPAADAVALWVVHTHGIDAAMVAPRLAITSPEKRCGKTTLLTLLRALVARPLATANMTTAVLFRVIEMEQPTLLIDEADTFIAGTGNMRGIINAGHSRATATVLRSAPDSRDGWEPRAFSVWGALALAAIGKLPGTIEDRSIRISMRRRRSDEAVEALRIDQIDHLMPLAQRAARWARDHHVILSAADPKVPPELHHRAADNWRPLLGIADAAGGEWGERARHAAILLTCGGAETDDSEVSGVLLLADLHELFAAEPTGVLFTAEVLDVLWNREDRSYSEYRRGRPITAPQLAALLRPFGIPTNQTVRRGTQTAKGYRGKDFADAWVRYLPVPRAVTQLQASDPAASDGPVPVTPADTRAVTRRDATENVTDES
jgi:putative DNA primase/helicase